jgi:protein gp37
MAENTKIQWTTHSWNPWRGCTKVHAGCAHCYAETLSGRNPGTLGVWGPTGTRVVASEAMWKEPLKWNREAEQFKHWKNWTRPRVFCASLADVFEDWQGPMIDSHGVELYAKASGGWCYKQIPEHEVRPRLTLNDVRRRLFALIDATPNLDWMLLTKRPENVRRMWPTELDNKGFTPVKRRRDNVWLGTSVSDQATADKWIPELLELRDLTPVLFVSAEPLIGPIDFRRWFDPTHMQSCAECNYDGERYVDTSKFEITKQGDARCPQCGSTFGGFAGDDCEIDLVIVGGESGHGARPCNVEWIRSIVKQCGEAGCKVFVKQVGANPTGRTPTVAGSADFPMTIDPDCLLNIKDAKGGAIDEWPIDIQVREMPNA